jgi:WXG100 family type VII secretion target
MAEAFRVNPDMVADAVERMEEFERYAESMLAEIDSLVTNLHAAWSGEAATAHVKAHQHWAGGEAMMREALASLKAAGVAAHHNYTGVMAKNLGMWS